jgi:YD repeat-containing protein
MVLSKRTYLMFSCLACMLLIQPLTVSAETVSCQYDVFGRLTSAAISGGNTFGYTYDAVGNRVTESISTTAAAASPTSSADIPASNGTGSSVEELGNKASNSDRRKNSDSHESSSLNNDDPENNIGNDSRSFPENAVDNPSVPFNEFKVYEDAEDGIATRWEIVEGPSSAYALNVYSAERESQVIELNGDGLLNSFRLLTNDGTPWNDTDHTVIQWSMKYDSDFVISVAAQTSSGMQYLSFTPNEEDNLSADENIYYGLGSGSKDGKWHTYVFDLKDALHEVQPNITIQSLTGFYVRGSGRIDDVRTWKKIPVEVDAAGE